MKHRALMLTGITMAICVCWLLTVSTTVADQPDRSLAPSISRPPVEKGFGATGRGGAGPCDGAIYNNGPPDGEYAYISTVLYSAAHDSWVADDFTLAETMDITGMSWWTAENIMFNWTGAIEIRILTDDAGAPGTLWAELSETEGNAATATRTDTCVLWGVGGLRVWLYETTLDTPICVPAGTWWIAIRTVQVGPVFASSWVTTSTVTGSEAHVLNEGQTPDPIITWTPGSEAYWPNEPLDMAFCIHGQPGSCPVGSCCWLDAAIAYHCEDNMSYFDCLGQAGSLHRWTPGTLCADLDPLCGGGACCQDADCTKVGFPSQTPEQDCAVLPGSYQPGVPCDPNPCSGACCRLIFDCNGDVINGDGKVDGDDVSGFVNCYLGTGGPGNCPLADMDDSGGPLDETDLNMFVDALIHGWCGGRCVPNKTEAECNAYPYGQNVWNPGRDCSAPCVGPCCVESEDTCDLMFDLDCQLIKGAVFQEVDKVCEECGCSYEDPTGNGCVGIPTPAIVAGTPLTFSGDNTCATDESCDTIAPSVWVGFQVTECSNVTVDYCDSPTPPGAVIYDLYTSCDCVTEPLPPIYGFTTWDECVVGADDGRISVTWANVPIGTYYYPISGDPADGGIGPWMVNFNATAGSPPEANDDCSTPTVIAGLGSWTFNSTCGTTDPSHENGSCIAAGDTGPSADLWWRWTAPTDCAGDEFCIALCDGTAYDSVMVVYDTTNCAAITVGNQAGGTAGCSDDDCGLGAGPSRVTVTVPSYPHEYLIRIGGWNNDGGPGVLTITCERCPALGIGPDICTEAEVIACGDSRVIDLTEMSGDPGSDPLIPCYYTGPDQADSTAWYLFTATAESVQMKTCNSPDTPGSVPLDTQLTLWSGNCSNFGRATACSEDSCGVPPDNPGWLSAFCIDGLIVDHTYLVEISSYGGQNANVALLEVTCPCPPVGACCDGGTCIADVWPEECEMLGGVWFDGPGELCCEGWQCP